MTTKRYFSFGIMFLICLFSKAQIPTIYAEGFDEKIVDWQKVKEEHYKAGDGLDYFYNDCGLEIEAFKASSTLPNQKDKSYHVRQLTDENPMTAWVPNGSGIGATFEVLAGGVTMIYNGYQATPKLWKENSRVKKMKVYSNGKPLCFLILEDRMGGQYVDLPGEKVFSDDNKRILKFEILEKYPGTKYQDVALSEIAYSGCCFAGDVQITQTDGAAEIQNMKANLKILSLDLQTGETLETEVLKTAMVFHGLMLNISTTSHTATLTPEHPLFVRNHGFISLKTLKELLQIQDYSLLANQAEILIWDDSIKTSRFEKLKTVHVQHGKVKTFSIQKLKTGETYIANGFITKTY